MSRFGDDEAELIEAVGDAMPDWREAYGDDVRLAARVLGIRRAARGPAFLEDDDDEADYE